VEIIKKVMKLAWAYGFQVKPADGPGERWANAVAGQIAA
jgi:hypothetical protein